MFSEANTLQDILYRALVGVSKLGKKLNLQDPFGRSSLWRCMATEKTWEKDELMGSI